MKPNEIELKRGMVVQLSPEVGNPMFACCMMTIDERKDFGAQGYVQAVGEKGRPGGVAFYRAKWEEMEFVGHAVWQLYEDR